MTIETKPIIRRVSIPTMYSATTTVELVVGSRMLPAKRNLSHRERYIMRESSRNRARVQTDGINSRSAIHREKDASRLETVRRLIASIDTLAEIKNGT